MRRTNIIKGLTLTAIFDAEKGPIQCRFVKVTRSQPVLVEHAEDKHYTRFDTIAINDSEKGLFNVNLSKSPGHGVSRRACGGLILC